MKRDTAKEVASKKRTKPDVIVEEEPSKKRGRPPKVVEKVPRKKREKPYEAVKGQAGRFIASGSEPIDSPTIALRMPLSMYEQLVSISGEKKAEWIRQAIKEKLERDSNS